MPKTSPLAGTDQEPCDKISGPSAAAEIGGRIRLAREKKDLSLRRLAAKVDISPSALSQIETGRSRPSIGTLYAIVSELGVSLDELFSPDGGAGPGRPVDPAGEPEEPATPKHRSSIVQRAPERKVIELDSGVIWERLNPPGEGDVEFLEVTYDVGGASSRSGTFVRHGGREYGLVLSGVLKVTVGFEDHQLGPGDSIVFQPAIPHRLEAVGDKPVKAVWFVIGRSDPDLLAG